MRKRIALLLAMAVCFSSAACAGKDPAATTVQEVQDGQETGEIPSVDEEAPKTEQDAGPGAASAEEGGASGDIRTDAATEAFEFTKGADDKELEKPITAYALKFNDSGVVEGETNGDIKTEHSLSQSSRDNMDLYVSILGRNYSMDDYLAKKREDNMQYVTTIARGHNIQTADAVSTDGSAEFTAIRYTNFEDGGENDYMYMGNLAYTDGTSVAATEFLYSVDREYGNGEEVEAWMKAVLERYGIDYGGLEWITQ